MFKILLVGWSVDIAMDDECEKSKMKKANIELAYPISSLKVGSEEMPIEEYVQLAMHEIIYI